MRQVRQACCMCKQIVLVDELDSSHPEAPTMFRVQIGGWSGFITEGSGALRIVCCSEACARLLLAGRAEHLQ
jgi:hypothetical protein